MTEDLEQQDKNGLTFEDYRGLIVRRRWWFLSPVFALGLIGSFVAHVWPPLYRSEALILVEQQKVPDQYVTPNVITRLQERLDSMTQQILSRTRLQQMIESFNLYAKERSRMTMDEVIDKMRERIKVEPVQVSGRQGDLTAFRIYYSASSPSLAQRVTNELTSKFITENLTSRTELSNATTSFLENQLEAARKDLETQENTLRQYKLRYLGELPEQMQGNLQILSSLEAQLYTKAAALDRAEQQRIYLESLKAEYQAMQKSAAAAAARARELEAERPDAVRPPTQAEITLSALRKNLAELKLKYKPGHPDLVSAEQLVAQWDAIVKKESESASGRQTQAVADATLAAKDTSLVDVESRLKAIAAEIDSGKRETEDLRQRIRQLQARLNLTPVREQQLAEVTRNYQNSRENYQSLLQRKMQSALASNLETRQAGEKFTLLDSASLPVKPSEPDRGRIVLVSWALGLLLGIGLMVLRELTDRTVRTVRDISEFGSLSVIAQIPVLRSPGESTRHRWRLVLEAVGTAALLLISVGVGIQTYLRG